MSVPPCVLFIATSANAEHGRGGRRRVVDVATQSHLNSFEARILCFLPFEQVLRGPRFWRGGRKSLSLEAGCPVSYAPMLPLTRFELVEGLNLLWCGLLAWVVSQHAGSKVIYCHGTRAAAIGLVARSLRKATRVVVDVHGVGSAEYAYALGSSASQSHLRALRRQEQQVLSRADQVIFVSERMRAYFQVEMRQPFDTARVIPCAVDATTLPDLATRDLLRSKFGITDRLVIAYVGSAVAYQQPRQMLSLFAELRQNIPNAFFLGLTQSPQVFQELLTEFNIPTQDYLLTSLPHAEVADYLKIADGGLLLREDSLLNQVSSPTKFAEYLLCGVPVILTSAVGDYAGIASQNNLGYVLDPQVPQAEPSLLEFIAHVRANRADFARRCQSYALDHLSWQHFAPLLADTLTSLS